LDIGLVGARLRTEAHDLTIARRAALTSVEDQSGIASNAKAPKLIGTISTGATGAALLDGRGAKGGLTAGGEGATIEGGEAGETETGGETATGVLEVVEAAS
jgi:hypothetical protein